MVRRCHLIMLFSLLSTLGCGPIPITITIAPPIQSTLAREPTAAELTELWVEPANISERDLFYGVGGAARAPDPSARYEFVSEKFGILSYSRGYKVRDPSGVQWSVKLGKEVGPEIVASRLIWAVGYHQLPTYYVARWQLYRDGTATAQPAARFRPKQRGYKKRGSWSWQQNPFVGTRPYRGLIVLMVMLHNWDLITDNNALYHVRAESEGAHHWYIVQDVGASFSRLRGRWFDGARNDIEGFAHQGFIDAVRDGRVIFDWNGPHPDLLEDITPDDVRWIADKLAQLSPTQWDDALRAGGYAPPAATLLRRKLAENIARGRSL